MKGLPGSGKTTKAKQLVDMGYVRVCKDDLRKMFHNGEYSKSNEVFILKCRDWAIRAALRAGKSVVVDDTNFEPKHAQRLLELATEHDAVFVERYIPTPLEVCVERDSKRADSVGEKVIRGMYERYLKPKEPVKATTYEDRLNDLGKIIYDAIINSKAS